MGKDVNAEPKKTPQLPHTYVKVKVYGEPKTQEIRFDVVLRPSDGSLYRLRLPMNTIMENRDVPNDVSDDVDKKHFTLEDVYTLEKKTVEPFQKNDITKFHVHKGDETIKLKDTICSTTTDWCSRNGYYLFKQVRKGKGISLVLKMRDPNMIAMQGLSIAQELYKQRRLKELWDVLRKQLIT